MDEGMREETNDAIDIKEPLKLKIIQDGNLIRSTGECSDGNITSLRYSN